MLHFANFEKIENCSIFIDCDSVFPPTEIFPFCKLHDRNQLKLQLLPAKHNSTVSEETTALPASYDLRDYGLLTSIKNQGDTNTCWAHAAMASAESNMLKTGLADEILEETELDLSEAHFFRFPEKDANGAKTNQTPSIIRVSMTVLMGIPVLITI